MNLTSALTEKLLHAAIASHATDIHFSPFADYVNIYFRVFGKRTLHKKITNEQYRLLLTYYKFTSGMDIGEVRKPQNGTIVQEVSEKKFALRLSTLPVNHSESLAIRILPQEETYSLDQLFLFPNQLNQLKEWIRKPSGLILLTGPTGSGKTTTLYTLLQTILVEKSYQTITLEDPIEKNIEDILQVQVNEKAGITYQTGLKAALRHDPDMIMIGEIRDRFTAKFAFDASLTGHLVLSTLHANNASGTIHRLLEMGLSKSELKQSLIAVAALQLIPVQIAKRTTRRAAIMELLDETSIHEILNTGTIDNKKYNKPFHSFHHLRKKAFAYGFITEEVYEQKGK